VSETDHTAPNESEVLPSIAIATGGETVTIPPDVAMQLIASNERIAREWRRARGKFGARGAIVLIDQDLIDIALTAIRRGTPSDQA